MMYWLAWGSDLALLVWFFNTEKGPKALRLTVMFVLYGIGSYYEGALRR